MSLPPVASVSALIFDRQGRVLLVRRGKPPAQGKWHAPGGRVEPGESLTSAVLREIREETAIEEVRLGPIIAVVERQLEGFHYLIVDFLGFLDRPDPPWPKAGDDALDARWISPHECASYELGEGLLPILAQGLRLHQGGCGGLVDVDGRGTDFVAKVCEVR
jgi:ADP-ribose pyrophosphatase YjhB (NUDIX family)